MSMLDLVEVAVEDQKTGPSLPDPTITLEVSEPNGELYGFTASGEERRAIIVHTAYPVPDDSEIETGKARNVIGKARSITLPLQSAGVGVQVSSTLFVPVAKEEKKAGETAADETADPEDKDAE